MFATTFLTIIKAENGFVIQKGNNPSLMHLQYAAQDNETVLKLVKEHLDSFNLKPKEPELHPNDPRRYMDPKTGRTMIVPAACQHEERYNIEETR